LWCGAVPVACFSGRVVVVPAVCLVLPRVWSCLSPCPAFSFVVFGAVPLFRGSARSPWFPSSSCCHRCSPFPPREQLLEAVVQGALLVVVVVSPRRLSHGPLLPPHEQMLAVGVEGAVVVAVVVVFPSLVRGRCRPVSHFVFLLVISLSSLFRPPRGCHRPLAPPIHPASSGGRGC
jgi:hypothetical protein